MLDLETMACAPLACNSSQSESWHGWSSNGRWIVFSSKRRDGLFAKPYFAYVNEDGTTGRAFVLPQEDPAMYDSFVKTYSLPELITGPVPVTMRQLAEAVRATDEVRAAQLDPDVVLPEKPEEYVPAYSPAPALEQGDDAPLWPGASSPAGAEAGGSMLN